ncbi:MAG: hypothetical protein U5K30_12455 [Acidimicrobiales bacterium]|nr:hypothetical protein [Acidimicrobiales bacterium]
MRRFLVVAVLVASTVSAGCDDGRRALSRDDLPDVPAEATVVVEIGDDGFDTGTLEIETTDLVEFRNVGDDDHGVRTEDFSIDTGPIFPDEFTLVVFDEPDEYEIIDTEDPDQSMTVTVRAPTAR